jgi:hypothetical protein
MAMNAILARVIILTQLHFVATTNVLKDHVHFVMVKVVRLIFPVSAIQVSTHVIRRQLAVNTIPLRVVMERNAGSKIAVVHFLINTTLIFL